MDRTQSRQTVYCHECDNEWPRDQGGLQCPRCRSEFVEVVEAEHDPREEPTYTVPDPDEDDISEMRWQRDRNATRDGDGNYRVQVGGNDHIEHTYTTRLGATRDSDGNNRVPAGQNAGQNPLIDSFNSMFGSILGGRLPQEFHEGTNRADSSNPTQQNSRASQVQHPPGLRVHTGGGPGFRWQVTMQNGPIHMTQRQQVAPFSPLLDMMLGSHPHMAGRPTARGQDPFGEENDFQGRGVMPMNFLAPFLTNMLGHAHPGRIGDAVYTQEALDRIITQLMEQNQSGNAPGPASEEAIGSLPTRKINEKDLGQEAKAECSICMEEVNIGQEVTELPCGHWFHGECVKAWLVEHDTCPHCRSGIMPRDDNANRPRGPGEAPRHDRTWGQGSGTQASPYEIAESPERPRTRGIRRRSSNSAGPSSSADDDTLFGRMRNAFGGGGGSA